MTTFLICVIVYLAFAFLILGSLVYDDIERGRTTREDLRVNMVGAALWPFIIPVGLVIVISTRKSKP